MRWLLINPHPAPVTAAGYYRRFLAPMPPISLAYLAACLERAGVDVRVHDDGVCDGRATALDEALRRTRPDVVGLPVVTATMPTVAQLVRRIRARCPEATVVLGNLHADLYAHDLLAEGLADVVVHGEGEETVVDLARALASGDGDPSAVQGISFRRDGETTTTPPRPLIEDLDSLPMPAWHLFPVDRYRLFNFARVREPGTLVLGSRGCPYRCTYCSLKVMGTRRRRRSAANIADEFEFLADRFGVAQPSFVDPIFPFDRQEGLEFADELIRRGLHRRQVWITETRTDRVDPELLLALRESGLRRIMFGFECAHEDSLDGLNKGQRADEGFAAVAAAREAGLQVIGFFMLGVPGETRATLQATIDYARALDVDFAKFTVFAPFPGTEVHGTLLRSGEIEEPEAWERYTSYPTRDCPPNYVPRALSAADVIRGQRRAYASFYLRPRMALRHLVRIRTLSPRDAVDGLRALAGTFSDYF